jgi:hypothetical protein
MLTLTEQALLLNGGLQLQTAKSTTQCRALTYNAIQDDGDYSVLNAQQGTGIWNITGFSASRNFQAALQTLSSIRQLL